MCGFAGFVGKVEDRETVLVNMMDTIIHRGPDSAGKYVDEEVWCLFSMGKSITIRNCEKN